MEGDLLLLRTWARASSSSGLFFSREGPIEEFGAAEELAEAPEAIEMHVVLWQVARCTSAKDFAGGVEGFST